MRVISSKENKTYKQALSLSERKYRDSLGMYLCEGPNLVKEAFMHGGRPRFIFTQAGADSPEIAAITQLAEEKASALFELTGDLFARLSQTETPQGVIAVMEKPVWGAEEFFKAAEGKNILVADRLQDPGNMGTLIRTAEAMGFGGIMLIKGCADVYSPKVVRSTAGSLLRMPLYFAPDAKLALKLLSDYGKKPYSAVMRSEIRCTDADLRNAAIIIGNEGQGVSEYFLENTEQIYIPMAGETESLNAALAGAIIMYEALRQNTVGA